MRDARALVILVGCMPWSPQVEILEQSELPVPRDAGCEVCGGSVPRGADHYCLACSLSGHEFALARERRDAESLRLGAEMMANPSIRPSARRAEIKARLEEEAEERRRRRKKGPITFQPRIRRRDRSRVVA